MTEWFFNWAPGVALGVFLVLVFTGLLVPRSMARRMAAQNKPPVSVGTASYKTELEEWIERCDRELAKYDPSASETYASINDSEPDDLKFVSCLQFSNTLTPEATERLMRYYNEAYARPMMILPPNAQILYTGEN